MTSVWDWEKLYSRLCEMGHDPRGNQSESACVGLVESGFWDDKKIDMTNYFQYALLFELHDELEKVKKELKELKESKHGT